MSRDSAEFTKLLRPYYNDALRYVRALCSNWSPDDAEDVLQQSFLRALENFENLKDLSKFKSWFFKIITREFYTAVRKHFWKRFLPLDTSPDVAEMPEVFTGNNDIDTDTLYHALSKLSAKERAAILLFEVAEFSIEEITAMQEEKSISAVKSRLSRVRTKLRKYLTGHEKEPETGLNNNEMFSGDLEYETIRLINEIRTEK